MKLRILLLASFLFIFVCVQGKMPKSIYKFKVPAHGGGIIDLSKYKGRKILIVNVTAINNHSHQYAELETTYKPMNAEIVVYCHIHRPFIRKVGHMTVCNTGSVGSPYDGDPRASYLLIQDGKPAIRRVPYDVEKEVGRLLASNYPQKEWIAEMRRKGSYLPPPENE